MAAIVFEMPDRIPVVPPGVFSGMCHEPRRAIKSGQINKDGKLIAQTHLVSQEKRGYDGSLLMWTMRRSLKHAAQRCSSVRMM